MRAKTNGKMANRRNGRHGIGTISRNSRFADSAIPSFAPSRRAFTLVELIIVLTVATAIVGVAVMLIELLLRSERDTARGFRNARVLMRVSQIFREDVHAAERVEVNAPEVDKKPGLNLGLSDGRRVYYEIDAHELRRTESQGDKASHQDTFRFPPRSELRFEVVEKRSIVQLEIRRARGSEELTARDGAVQTENVPARIIVLEAALDRDRRLAGGTP